jgi:hypothetical protein
VDGRRRGEGGSTCAMVELFPTRLSPINNTAWFFMLGLLFRKFGLLKSKTTADGAECRFVFDRRVQFHFPFFVLLGFSLWLKKVKKSCCFINIARMPQPFLRYRYSFDLSHVNSGRRSITKIVISNGEQILTQIYDF